MTSEMMEYSAGGLPVTLKEAFQEYDLDQLDPERDAFTIIGRTLSHGKREELRWLFGRYGRKALASWVAQAGPRLLPRRRLLFWTAYFDLPDLPEREGAWPH